MPPTAGNNFLLSFDYKLPGVVNGSGPKNILYIHSTRPRQSRTAIARLTKMNPAAQFHIVARPDVSFSDLAPEKTQFFTYAENALPPDYPHSAPGNKLKEVDIDLAFFCINLNISASFNLLELKAHYSNLFECVQHLGLKHRTHVIDRNFQVFKLSDLDIDSWTRPWEVKGHTLCLPWTLLHLEEKEELFELARSGPGEGAIVNIGHFLGGSSIILAKGSKQKNREKIHSFDIREYPTAENLFSKNQVEDWIIFKEKNSEDAAREWGKRKDPGIRLLFIDGDHSYEGCKRDIVNWVPYLVPGGIIALHDYCNVSEGVDFASIVRAVYETILTSGEFCDFRRTETLFMATKK